MMKILGFDSWTVGSHHYQRLMESFARRGMTLQLVHVGSWGNDVGRPPVEAIGTLPVRDISSYRGESLEAVLDEEKPDAVILLSTMLFVHRAFVRYCRVRGIPTLNLYHGLTTTWFDVSSKSGIPSNRLGHARFVFKKLKKVLRYTIPCYVTSLRRTNATSSEWFRFLSDLAAMLTGRHIAKASADALTDACAVYTDPEVDHAVYTYGFPRDAIHVVGNPDLVRFGVSQEDVGSYLREVRPLSHKAMYIDTGLAPTGLIFASAAQYADHLLATNESLKAQGWQMLLKPHPAQSVSSLQAALNGSGIQLIGNSEFIEYLRECDAAIVETTSLALVPALMGMPLLFAKHGQLRDLEYGTGLTSYPRADFLSEADSFAARLRELSDRNTAVEADAWIRANLGPVPADQMPDRVADCILSILPAGGDAPCVR